MSFPAVARYFGFSLLVVGLAMLVPTLYALVIGDRMAGNYAFSAAATIFSGGGLRLLAGRAGAPVDLRDVLLLILLWWTATPFFGALPFWLDGWKLIDGYFEAVSALTTTGATLESASYFEKPVDLLWRGILQWIGGLASLAIAAAVFIRPAFTGADTLAPAFSRGVEDSYARAISSAVRAFGGIYALITLVALLALVFAGVAVGDAMVLAMSTIASGGLMPAANGFAGLPAITPLLLAPFIFISGLNFILIERRARGLSMGGVDDESLTYLALAILVSLALIGFAGGRAVAAPVFNGLSLISTNGVMIGPPPPLVFALVTVVIGGSAVSTAGGLKILRWMLIMRRTQFEIRRLITPGAVFGPRSSEKEFGVWMHFLVFTILLGLLTATLTAGGHRFEVSAAGAVGALANVGPVIGLAPDGIDGFRLFDDAAIRLILAFAMIIGRLEGVAALMLINRAFWRS